MTDKKYRWADPGEWLSWAYDNGKVTAAELLHLVIKHVDADYIQDEFQAAMDEDGYFEEMRERRLDIQFPDRLEDKLIDTDVDECPRCQFSMDLYEQPDEKQYLLCCNCEYRDDNYGFDPNEASQ